MAPVYSPEQVSQFLDFIQVPKHYYAGAQPLLDHSFLTVLHTRMITAVPYENLKLHYSPHRRVNLDPQVLFRQVVLDGRGRGGYCMENSLLMLYMLQALGFHVYPVGVRVRPRKDGVPHGEYMGWVHIVNIVTLADSTRWAVDVSFGGDGATRPMPLEDGQTWRNMGTQEARLVRDYIPGQTELTPGRRLWVYQCRNGGAEQPWRAYFAFSDAVEWLPEDFAVANCYTGSSPASFQTWTVLVVKFLRRPAADGHGVEDDVYGKRMLVDGLVKENTSGKTRVVQECRTEEERVKALKEWFGIELTDDEVEAIKGHPTALAS